MTDSTQIQTLVNAFGKGIMPPPELDLCSWSEEFVHLAKEDSSSQGKFVAWPFQREPLEVMSPSHPCERVSLMCASQMMKTRLFLNVIAYIMAKDPGPTLIIEPTQDDAESLSKDRVDPMIRETPALHDVVAEAKSRDAGNTIFHKRFKGGHLTMAYSTSPSKLAMRPIRYLIFDEVSRYNASSGKEGDPVRLGEKRTITFWNRKIYYSSSPGLDGVCRISKIHKFSDQREWFVPCPYCNAMQTMVWGNLKFSTKDQPIVHMVKNLDGSFSKTESVVPMDAPKYQCISCQCLISESYKNWMNENGKYIAQNPKGKFPGFRVTQLNSPIRSWEDIVQEWMEAQGHPEQLQVFFNTVMAETYKIRGEAPDWERMKARALNYSLGTVPKGVLFITAGADIQKDRIEIDVWGWGRRGFSWLIDHHVVLGDTSSGAVYEEATDLIRKSYIHPSGLTIPIRKIAIDSGHETTMVYRWCRKLGTDFAYPVKGMTSGHAIFWRGNATEIKTRNGKVIRKGIRPWLVNTSRVKSDFYGWLNVNADEKTSFGRVHTPQMPDEWYQQVTAEHIVTVTRKGYQRAEFQMVPGQVRNEALDMRGYAQAIAEYIGLTRFTDADWDAMEAFYENQASRHGIVDYAVQKTVTIDPLNVSDEDMPPPAPGERDAVMTATVAQQSRRRGRVRFRMSR